MARLFAYGVLIRELAQGRAAELIAPLGDAVPATTRGALYAVKQEGASGQDGGWYPIMLPDLPSGEVRGVVCAADHADWAGMDEFEDALGGPDAEYVRRLVPIVAAGGSGEAFAYCYARALPADAEPIEHGDFARWLRETGRSAISGR